MKSNKDFRAKGDGHSPDDAIRKNVKLPPIKKSGKERHQLYSGYDEALDDDLETFKKRESVLDYFEEEEL